MQEEADLRGGRKAGGGGGVEAGKVVGTGMGGCPRLHPHSVRLNRDALSVCNVMIVAVPHRASLCPEYRPLGGCPAPAAENTHGTARSHPSITSPRLAHTTTPAPPPPWAHLHARLGLLEYRGQQHEVVVLQGRVGLGWRGRADIVWVLRYVGADVCGCWRMWVLCVCGCGC